jgi:hypothetical protein
MVHSVCLKTSAGKTTCEVMSAKTATLELDACPAWVLPNAGARGYYRTSYSPAMLRKIAAGIAAVPSAERIGLLSDEWALVRAGRHDVGSYMDLASVFASERTTEVMATLTGTLRGRRRPHDASVASGISAVGVEAVEAGVEGNRVGSQAWRGWSRAGELARRSFAPSATPRAIPRC